MTASNDESKRKAFEDWYIQNYHYGDIHPSHYLLEFLPNDTYENEEVGGLYEAFIAGRASNGNLEHIENGELLKDKDRLDWLERSNAKNNQVPFDPRKAIDEAIAAIKADSDDEVALYDTESEKANASQPAEIPVSDGFQLPNSTDLVVLIEQTVESQMEASGLKAVQLHRLDGEKIIFAINEFLSTQEKM